jgi:hypothetical protein
MVRMFTIVSALLLFSIPLCAQPGVSVSPPVTLDLGLGGGVSLPTGDLSNGYNTGYNLGGKLRIGSLLPFNLVASGMYNSLPRKAISTSDNQVIVGGGVEYAIPSAGVHPYFGADALYVRFNSGESGVPSINRGGLGIGAGVEFTIPAFGSFDTSVKYQFLNLMGKEALETTASQIAATVTLMVNLL